MKQTKITWRVIRLVLTLLFYFSFLTFVSYLRADKDSMPMRLSSVSTLTDFQVLEGAEENTVIDGDLIRLDSHGVAATSGVYAEVSLADVKKIFVRFQACGENAGTLLTLDLCAENYDRSEQEVQLLIPAGDGEYSVSLKSGEGAPEKARLRFFATEPAKISLRSIELRAQKQVNINRIVKVSGLIALILGLVLTVEWFVRSGISQRMVIGRLWRRPHSENPRLFSKLLLLLLFAPILFSALSFVTHKRLDVALRGEFQTVTLPELTMDGLKSGSWQRGVENWWNETFAPRGVFIKTNNQIRYSLFHESNRVVGKNRSLFEPLYIQAELALLPELDASVPETRERLEAYLEKLNTLGALLEEKGKKLIVYTSANKAAFQRDQIPDSFTVQQREGAESLISHLRTMQDAGQPCFPYLDTGRLLSANMEYPVFYKTGIHWSRTAEQLVSQRLMEMVEDVLGRKVPQISLGEAVSSREPFWRDGDLYDLLNVWLGARDSEYYEYRQSKVNDTDFQDVNILLIGGSFAMGLERSVAELKLGNTDYINYAYGSGYRYLRRNWDDNSIVLLKTIEALDFQKLLDRNEIVVIELNESVLARKSTDDKVIDMLLAFLPGYKPQKYVSGALKRVSFPFGAEEDVAALIGFYRPEERHIWSGRESSVAIWDENIGTDGLELALFIPEELPAREEDALRIFVNGELLYEHPLSAAGDFSLVIPAEKLRTEDGVYRLEFKADESYNPMDLGIADDRDLSFCLLYAGPARR